MRVLFILLAILSLNLAARAEVQGRDDPELQAAVGDWLAGNEADALPALAALAVAGNTAARLLLTQIDSFPALQGDWLAALPRADRIAVLRAPGGVSGQRWTRELDDPIAQAWVRLWDTSATPQVIVDFARLGEPRAARFAALTLARRQRQGFAAVGDDPAYPASLQAYVLAETGGDARSLHPADPQLSVLGRQPDAAGFSGWAETVADADPVIALCETLCPHEDPGLCRPAALQGMGGYWGLMPLGSPVEALVPSPVFNRSPRGLDSTLRSLRGPMDSACLTDRLK